MEKITIQELLESTGGKLLNCDDPQKAFFSGVCTDNRKVQSGDLFAAIVGERLDGHRFAGAAMEAGAAGCLISDESCAKALMDEAVRSGSGCGFFVLVEDTVKALGALAAYYRRKFRIPVIAVTGSVGKTTTKQMLAAVLSQKYHVLYTEGNLNNHIGLPMTVFRMDHTHEAAVLEMGMNHFSEIDYLVRIAAPDIAVITNVGDAHIQNLGSRENIFRAKCEIFHGLKEGGTAILNGDDALLRTLWEKEGRLKAEPAPGTDEAEAPEDPIYAETREKGIRFVRIGEAPDCDLQAEEIQADGDSVHLKVREHWEDSQNSDKDNLEEHFALDIPAPGRHMIYPALTAAAAGFLLGLTHEEIAAGVRSFVQTGMRMKSTRTKAGGILLNDAYNANPQSMKAALQVLRDTAGVSRRIAVLGDMLELGEFSEKLHREVGAAAAQAGIDVLVTVGPAARMIAEEALARGMKEVHSCADKSEAEQILRSMEFADTAVLFKASRGMALEVLAAVVQEMPSGKGENK